MSGFEYVGAELDLFATATNWKAYVASLLRPVIRGSVLEVGAGIGATTAALWHDEVNDWVCLEPDPAMATRLAEAELPGVDPTRVEVVVGTMHVLEEMPSLAGRVFNTILYVDVLEHIENDREELRLATARLAPGGAMVVLAPAFMTLFSEFDRSIGHYRRYSARSLSAVFPPGLKRERVFYADSLGVLLSLANRMLLKQSLPSRAQVQTWDRFVVPMSRMVDPVLGSLFGRSVIAIYRRT